MKSGRGRNKGNGHRTTMKSCSEVCTLPVTATEELFPNHVHFWQIIRVLLWLFTCSAPRCSSKLRITVIDFALAGSASRGVNTYRCCVSYCFDWRASCPRAFATVHLCLESLLRDCDPCPASHKRQLRWFTLHSTTCVVRREH